MVKRKAIIKLTISILVLFATTVLFSLSLYIADEFDVSFETLLYTICSPTKGTAGSVFEDGLTFCKPIIICGTALLILIMLLTTFLCYRIFVSIRNENRGEASEIKYLPIIGNFGTVYAAIILLITIFFSFKTLDIFPYLERRINSTTIYEDYYVNPTGKVTKSRNQTNNLIFIYLESMETTYADTDNGGVQNDNYIPYLTELAYENITFSNGKKLGGYHASSGTTWTLGNLLATTSGIPFEFPIDCNSMQEVRDTFAPDLVSLGDVLEEQGYKNYFMLGSDSAFAGTNMYLKGHGNYEIMDYWWAIGNCLLPSDYYVWWGFEDFHLYDFAKNELLRIASYGEPFNFTIRTVDTHHMDGYVCEKCSDIYDNDTANVVSCADRQVSDFIHWCSEQDFYDTTTIVIIGDHPRMDSNLVETVDYYDRTEYNCFINSRASENSNLFNREFCAMDIFPTTLAAMGFIIEGDRLGLGTNLFSNRETIPEMLGYDAFNDEISRYSKFYIDNFD